MPDFLGNIANFFGSPAGKGLGEAAGLGATGAGLIGNLAADRQRAAAAKAAQANLNLTPAQLAAQVNQATLPLNANLVRAITQNVSGNLAEEGLSQAPGLQAQAIAQGLAGPEQQQQQNAMELVFQKLGLPAELLRSVPPNANLSPLIALLLRGFQTNTPGAAPSSTGGAQGSYPSMPYPIEAAGAMPSPNMPMDWLGLTPNQQTLPPDMTAPDTGGY